MTRRSPTGAGSGKGARSDNINGHVSEDPAMSAHPSTLIPEADLPRELSPEMAVEAAYAGPLAEVASRLARGLPVLVECDKELSPYAFANVRGRLKPSGIQCLYLDGRPRATADPSGGGAMAAGFVGNMINQLRDAVRGAVERRVVVLPHLDLLTTSQGGLTAEAREVIPLLYENPELVSKALGIFLEAQTQIENLTPNLTAAAAE